MATTVTNFTQLKTAIESATETDIVVAGDITMLSGGARVNINKSSLTIDFGGYNVTDVNTLNVADTIYIPSTQNAITVTVKNATWSGRNYYGVVCVQDGNTNSTINLENITYNGPQFAYNKNGTTNITDCNITLERNGSQANPQEFCEACKLTIGGNVSVNSGSTSNAVIWFTNTGALLTVKENAKFEVTALSTYFLYTDVAPTMLFEQNSSTTISTKGGLFYAASSSAHIASSFTLKNGASFIAYKKGTSSAPMFKCLSSFVVEENATFKLFSEVSSTTALMYFGQVVNINITKPKSVVLYNNGGNCFSFQTGSAASPNQIVLQTQMLRLWNAATAIASAGNIDDKPTSEYYRADYNPNLTMTIKSTNSALISVENNLVSGDMGYPLTVSSFDLLKAKVIAMGELILSVNKITDALDRITGTADPLASMRVQYGENIYNGTAEESGNFAVKITNKVPVSTLVNVLANKNFLTKSMQVLSQGSVTVSAPSVLKFRTFPAQPNMSVVFRENTDFAVTVTDTRLSGGAWHLYCFVDEPLTSNDSTLEDALVFKTQGEQSVLSKSPLLVQSGTWKENEQTTVISWEKLEGFLLGIDALKTYNSGDYETTLFWQVEVDDT